MQKYKFHFGSALLASIVATIIMTISFAFFGLNIMKMLGINMGKSGMGAYIAGGIVHFAIGIFYGLIYAIFFANWMQKKLPGIIAGAIYGFLPFIIAMVFSGSFMQMTKGILADNQMPKAITPVPKVSEPAEKKESYADYPESRYDYPDSNENMKGRDPYHPYCSPDEDENNYMDDSSQEENYSSRPSMKEENRVTPPYMKNNGSSATYQSALKQSNWFSSLINHLIYGAVLGLVYRPRKIEMKEG